MPEYREVFRADINVDIQRGDELLGQLKAIEAQAVKTARAVSAAFTKTLDTSSVGRAKGFGAGIEGAVGSRGGFQKSAKELQQVAAVIDEIARASSLSIGQVIQDFDDLSLQIANSANIAAGDLDAFFVELQQIGEIRTILDQTGGQVNAAMIEMASNLSGGGKKILRALVEPFEDAREKLVGHSIVTDLTGEIPSLWDAMFHTLDTDTQAGVNEVLASFEKIEDASKYMESVAADSAKLAAILPNNFRRIDDAIDDSVRSMGRAIEEFGDATAKVISSGDLRGAISSAAEGFQAVTAAAEPALDVFGRLQRAYRLSSSEGGNLFQGLRTAIYDVAPATDLVAKGLDFLANRSIRRASDEFSDLSDDLVEVTARGSEFADDIRRGSSVIKDMQQRNKGLRRELNDVETMLNRNRDAWNRLAGSAERSGDVTEGEVIDVERSIKRSTDAIDAFRKAADLSVDFVDPVALKRMEEFEQALEVQNKQLDETRATASAAGRGVEKLGQSFDEADDEIEESTSILGKFKSLLGKLRGRDGLGGMDKTWDSFEKGSKKADNNIKGLSRSFFKAQIAADLFRNVMRGIGDAVGNAARAVGGFVSEAFGLGQVTAALSGIFNGFVDLAAQVDTLRETMETLGKNAGIPIDYLNERVKDLQKSGITTAGAYRQLTTFMSQKLPIDRITDLSRAAQDMAVAFGSNSTEAFERFTASIVRGSTELLDIFGVENASLMYERYAASIDVAANSLSHAQKQQAILNGILRAAEPFAGAYENALDSIGKKISSLARKIEEASLKLGEVFLPVLGEVVDRIGDFTKAFGTLIDDLRPQLDELVVFMQEIVNRVYGFVEGTLFPAIVAASKHIENFIQIAREFGAVIGALFSGDFGGALEALKQFLTSVAAYFSIAFGNIVSEALTWGKGIVSNIYEGLKQFLLEGTNWFSQAFQWGYNLIVELANGILDAANSILFDVINLIGNLMASFLAPGSPPERGPLSTIDEWGKGLMKVLTGGMLDAVGEQMPAVADAMAAGLSGSLGSTFRDLGIESFALIKDAMSVFQRSLQTLIGLGTLDESQLVPNMQELRELMVDLANTFEDTGKISEDVLDQIGDKFGEQSEDIKEYLRLQLQLQEAQKDLAAFDKEIEVAQRAGFVSEGLRAKQAEKKSEVDALTERFKLQKEIIDFQQQGNDLMIQQMRLLERIAKAQEKAADAAEKGTKDQWQTFLENHDAELAALEEKKRLGIISEEEYMRGRLSLEQRYIDTAIKLGKPLSDERVQAFKDLKEEVEKLRGGKGKGVKGLTEDTNELWETFLAGLDGFKSAGKITDDFLRKNIGKSANVARENFLSVRKEFEGIFSGLSLDIKLPFVDAIKKQAKTGIFAIFFARLPAILETVKADIGEFVTGVVNAVTTVVDGLIGFVSSAFSTVLDRGGVGALIESLLGFIGSIIGGIQTGIQNLSDTWNDIFGSSGELEGGITPFRQFMENLGTLAGIIVDTVARALTFFVNLAGPALGTTIVLFSEILGLLLKIVVSVVEIGIKLGNIIGSIIDIASFENFRDIVIEVKDTLTLFWDSLEDGSQAALVALGGLTVLGSYLYGGPGAFMTILNVALVEGIEPLKKGIVLFGDAAKAVPGKMSTFKTFLINLTGLAKNAALGFLGLLKQMIALGVSGTINAIKTAFIGLIVAMKAMVVSAIPALITGIKALVAAMNTSAIGLGLVVAAIGLAIVAADKFKKIVIDMEPATEGTENAKEAISAWAQEAEEMRKKGLTASDMVEEFADRVNTSRKAFDEGGALIDVLGRGKDVEIFNKAAEDTNAIMFDQTETWAEYIALIDRYNSLVTDDSMRITEEFTELQYDMGKATEGVTDSTDSQRAALEVLAQQEGFAGEVARRTILVQDEMAANAEKNATRRTRASRGIVQAEEAMDKVMSKHGEGLEERRRLVEEEIRSYDGLIGAYATTGTEISRMLSGRQIAEKEYQVERERIIAEGTTEELALLETRYAEEAAQRRIAIGEALLDLNNQILKEKLIRKGLTGPEAAEIVSTHRDQAAEIAAHYELPIESARRMSEESLSALRQAGLANEEFLASADLNLGEALTLFDKLDTEGYGQLEKSSQEKVQLMIGTLATMPEKIRPTFEEMAGIISILPDSYQDALLEMLGEDATLEEILGAFEALDKLKVEPEIEIKVSRRGSAREDTKLMSPKMQLETALESLVEYAEKNAVEIEVDLIGDSAEDLGIVHTAMLLLDETLMTLINTTMEFGQIFEEMSAAIRDTWNRTSSEVRSRAQDMKRSVVDAFRQMHSEVLGVMYALAGQLNVLMYNIGVQMAQSLISGLSTLAVYAEALFIGGKWTGLDIKFWEWGREMMRAFANGIISGKHDFVEDALTYVASQLPKSEPEIGPLAFTPDWSYLSDGLREEAGNFRQIGDALRNANLLPGASVPQGVGADRTTYFNRGAFEGAFPNVRTADDAEGIINVLNDVVERGSALGRIGSGF